MPKLTRDIAQKFLADVPDDKQFWCQDGRVFKNLTDLEKAFKDMTPEAYLFHVNEKNNDFSNWIKDIMGDELLAKDLRKASTAAKAGKIVNRRVAALKKIK